jgi:hypothetical protein
MLDRRSILNILFSLLGWASLIGVPCLIVSACSSNSTSAEALPTDTTIEVYCEQILQAFCTYAVNKCQVETSVTTCVTNARASCCQGACGRSVRFTAPETIQSCIDSYTGREAGVDDAGQAYFALPGLSCEEVKAGLLPASACSEIIELVDYKTPSSPDGGVYR